MVDKSQMRRYSLRIEGPRSRLQDPMRRRAIECPRTLGRRLIRTEAMKTSLLEVNLSSIESHACSSITTLGVCRFSLARSKYLMLSQVVVIEIQFELLGI